MPRSRAKPWGSIPQPPIARLLRHRFPPRNPERGIPIPWGRSWTHPRTALRPRKTRELHGSREAHFIRRGRLESQRRERALHPQGKAREPTAGASASSGQVHDDARSELASPPPRRPTAMIASESPDATAGAPSPDHDLVASAAAPVRPRGEIALGTIRPSLPEDRDRSSSTGSSPGEKQSIRVHIGRVEVTAAPSTSRPEGRSPRTKPRAPRLSLEDYLRRRDEGVR
jgi:hypothetical protein